MLGKKVNFYENFNHGLRIKNHFWKFWTFWVKPWISINFIFRTLFQPRYFARRNNFFILLRYFNTNNILMDTKLQHIIVYTMIVFFFLYPKQKKTNFIFEVYQKILFVHKYMLAKNITLTHSYVLMYMRVWKASVYKFIL